MKLLDLFLPVSGFTSHKILHMAAEGIVASEQRESGGGKWDKRMTSSCNH